MAFTSSPTVANTQPVAGSVTIKEAISNGALEVVLRDDDLPHGRPREFAAFKSGGETEIADGGIYLPGNTRPVVQIMKVKKHPFVLKGAFRDHLFDSGMPGHARAQRDALENIRVRANPVNITWAGETRQGVLLQTDFDEEGVGDIAYELTFIVIASPTDPPKEASSAEKRPAAPDDIATQMAANVAKLRAAQLALVVNAAVQAALSNAWTSVTSAMNDVVTYSTKFASAPTVAPQHILEASRQVQAACQAAQNNVATLRSMLDTTRADGAMVFSDAGSFVSWWSSLYSTDVALDAVNDSLRTIREIALAQIRQSTRLYRVQPGDTLESIALSQLGSRSRALDLGIRQDDLVVGGFVRISEAT